MIEALPWIVFLGLVAAVVGFLAGRMSLQSSPPGRAPENGKGFAADASASAKTTRASAGAALAAPAVRTAPAGSVTPVSNRSMTPQGSPAPAVLLAGAKSWGYQLQNLDVGRASASPFDLLVVDYAKEEADARAWKPAEIERLKTKPDGGRRLVVAYCSVGEAESYRSYWQKGWKRDKPAWLLGENPEWHENYAVCFWDPGWQRIVCGDANALIDQIVAQGFDGVYLDKCDVYEDLREHFKSVARSRPDLEGDMVGFVRRISAYAKSQRPGFLVILQNAEPLLERAELRAAIDAVAKEELLFGLDRPEKPNSRADVEEARLALDHMKRDGKPVFMVEYLANPPRIGEAAQAAAKLGYILYVAPKDRELARLNGAVPEV